MILDEPTTPAARLLVRKFQKKKRGSLAGMKPIKQVTYDPDELPVCFIRCSPVNTAFDHAIIAGRMSRHPGISMDTQNFEYLGDTLDKGHVIHNFRHVVTRKAMAVIAPRGYQTKLIERRNPYARPAEPLRTGTGGEFYD